PVFRILAISSSRERNSVSANAIICAKLIVCEVDPEGFEPSCFYKQPILSRQSLPIPPQVHAYRKRNRGLDPVPLIIQAATWLKRRALAGIPIALAALKAFDLCRRTCVDVPVSTR